MLTSMQVLELLDVLEHEGAEALAAFKPQPLSWEEVQALAGPGTVGLPLGYEPGGVGGRPLGHTATLTDSAHASDERGAGGGRRTRAALVLRGGRGEGVCEGR
jgi:hypothetical protein